MTGPARSDYDSPLHARCPCGVVFVPDRSDPPRESLDGQPLPRLCEECEEKRAQALYARVRRGLDALDEDRRLAGESSDKGAEGVYPRAASLSGQPARVSDAEAAQAKGPTRIA